ncbi:hypothetical protein P355_2854 [Burkholderia cenocepacia KC-01]|nr:hypothetical protein P355_2854 [Burkholderia cenocepacia KC-01]
MLAFPAKRAIQQLLAVRTFFVRHECRASGQVNDMIRRLLRTPRLGRDRSRLDALAADAQGTRDV